MISNFILSTLNVKNFKTKKEKKTPKNFDVDRYLQKCFDFIQVSSKITTRYCFIHFNLYSEEISGELHSSTDHLQLSKINY